MTVIVNGDKIEYVIFQCCWASLRLCLCLETLERHCFDNICENNGNQKREECLCYCPSRSAVRGTGAVNKKTDETRPSPNTLPPIPGPYNGMPRKVVGMYILLADDTEPG